MSKALDDEAIKVGQALQKLAGLAQQNFPSKTDLEVSASGPAATGSLKVSSYALKHLVDAALKTLEGAK
jgi:hypothetical protein